MKRFLNSGIPFVWMGMILAISFMEAPLKFTAPGITVELGLGIGRIVFSTLNMMELTLAVLLGFSWLGNTGNKKSLLLFSFVSFVLLFQTLWLLPALDQRAVQLLAGNPPPPSYHHLLYIALEAIKVISLAITGYLNLHDIKKLPA